MTALVRLLILVLILSSIVLLWLQNQQLISLTMFGFYRTPELGLGVWVILFTLAGIITSILLQLLFSISKTTQAKVKPKPPVKESVKNIPPESQQQPEVEWGDQSEKSEPWDNLNHPAPPSPEKTPETPPSTTYSYSYVKATPQEKKNSTDQIYDANYRIITPPYKESIPPPPEKDENEDKEDEEWI